MKKKIKQLKFAYGGTAMDIDSPFQSLSEIQRMKDDILAETANDPLVSGLKGMGTMMMNKGMSMVSSGMSQAGDMSGFGGFLQDNMGTINDITKFGMATQKFSTVAELPSGLVGQFSGPSHGEGGIDVDLPVGTDIYSKRVKVNGETMANRKLIREKQLSKFEKLFEKNPLDKNLKSTLDRIKMNTESLDNKDMMIQNSLHELHNSSKRAYGGTIYGEEDNLYEGEEELEDDEDILEEDMYLEDEDSEEDEEYIEDEDEDYFALGGTVTQDPPIKSGLTPEDIYFANMYDYTFNKAPRPMDYTGINPPQASGPSYKSIIDKNNTSELNKISEDYSTWNANTEENDTTNKGILGNFSMGDLIGMGGQMYGAISARNNTKKNRQGDTPNINPYKDYGKAGLNALSNAREGMEYNRDLSLQDLEASRNTMNSKNRKSARGINTLRALGLATDTSINNSKNKAFADYSTRNNALSLQEANMLNQRDRMVMSGEGTRNMNDRRDRDNFYTNMGTDNQNMSEAIQNLGKNLNTGLERGLNAEALSALSKYFDVDITADGFNMKNKKKK